MKAYIRRASCVCIVAFFLLCVSAVPASAHAVVESTNPHNGEQLAASPKKIEMRFSEGVETNFSSLTLIDAQGKQIELTEKLKTNGTTVSQSIPRLARGTYLVVWNVISSDTHPVRGAFTFSVDSVIDNDISSRTNLDNFVDGKDQQSVTTGLSVTRFVVFISIAAIIALLFMKAFLVQDIPQSLRRIFAIALGLCVTASMLSLLVYASYVGGNSLLSLPKFTELIDETSSRYSFVALARIGLCVGVLCAWKFLPKLNRSVAAIACIAFASTLAFSGHASAGSYSSVALILDIIHVLAASIWLGGLLSLPFFLSREDGIKIAQKFSRVATFCVVAIVFSGVFAWWRQVGSIDASTSTWFGQLVSFKSLLFLMTVAIAFFSRAYVRSLTNGDETSKKKLKFCIYGETILLVIVMAASSVLVGSVPGKSALASPVSFHKSVSTGYIDITVDPAKTGPTEIHVYMLNKNGTPLQVSDLGASLTKNVMTVTLNNKDRKITALPVDMKFQGLNHFVSVGAYIPFPGEWTLTIRVRVSEFDEIVTTTELKIRP